MTRSQIPHPVDAWSTDVLGPDYQFHTIDLGADPDKETDVVATVVRYNPDGAVEESDPYFSRPALLWVHGMTDYFFHTEFAEFFHNEGYAVYALDLRKCGRSHRPGQRWHYTTDLEFYFPDLNAAEDLITLNHPQLIPVAHSTGGLIVPLWLNHLREHEPSRLESIPALVLNSPWLDMMYPKLFIKAVTPLVKIVGTLTPKVLVPGGGLGTYGESIHKDFHGEWDFNTRMKPVAGHRKSIGWLKTILENQRRIHNDDINVGVDVLTLRSARSWLKPQYSEKTNASDAVLDVEQIQQWATHLSDPSSRVQVVPIENARHDIFLSREPVRTQAMIVMRDWLSERVSVHQPEQRS
ncbi:alpha/beta hydrolase [Corynebacterium deserti]|nr:alpha/beta hydrolase [Corynebacterium deserti]